MRLRSRRQLVPKSARDIHIGARLRRFRKEAGLTQLELADLIGMSPQTVLHYEKGHYTISELVMEKLAAALNIPRSLLTEGQFNAVTEMVPVLERISDPQHIMVLKATAEAFAAKEAV